MSPTSVTTATKNPKSDQLRAKHTLWQRGELFWKLHSGQRLIYKLLRELPPDQREALIFCSRRWGKSYLGVACAVEDAKRNPGKQVAIIGPTLKQTKAIVTPLMRDIVSDAPKGLITHNKVDGRWTLSNGSCVLIAGFDTVLESIRGLELFAIYLEESGLATSDLEDYTYLLYSVLMPTLMHSKGRIYHLTTPARTIDHPLHLETLPQCELAGAFYKFTIQDNPLLSPEDIEKEIETMGGRDSINVRRELFCEIVRDESITVVPQFDETRHTAALTHQPHYKYLVSGDMGYTSDLSAFHLMAYDHATRKVFVFAEKIFQPSTPTQVIVDSLKQDWGAYGPTYVVDIQGNTRTDMSAMGLATTPPFKDKFESNVAFIRNCFFQDTILIDPACQLLVQTCRSQTFNRARTDYLRTHTLGHADALMSLLYGLRSIDRVTDLRPRPNPENIFVINSEPAHHTALKGLAWRRT